VYAAKIRAEELRINWSRPAVETHRLVRVGGAWTTFRGKRVKVLAAELADADAEAVPPTPGLRLTTVQPEGKGPMAFADFVRGARPQADERFE
jgi:methionyl-tRNA formyltransferase